MHLPVSWCSRLLGAALLLCCVPSFAATVSVGSYLAQQDTDVQVTISVDNSAYELEALSFVLTYPATAVELAPVSPTWAARVITEEQAGGLGGRALAGDAETGRLTVTIIGNDAEAIPGVNKWNGAENPAIVTFTMHTRQSAAEPYVLAVSEVQARYGGEPVTLQAAAGTIRVYRPPSVVMIAPAGGLFRQDVQVTLTAADALAIHYTTDGTTPDTQSQPYAGPFSLPAAASQHLVLQAIAYGYGGASSAEIASAAFDFDLQPPAVTAVSARLESTAERWYRAGQALPLRLTFSESVTLSTGGVLQVQLQTDTDTRTVALTALTGTTEVDFEYVVTADDRCQAALRVGALVLAEGATLTDAAGNPVGPEGLILPPGGNLDDGTAGLIRFDTQAPVPTVATAGDHGPNRPLPALHGSASDPGGSGLLQVQVALRRGNPETFQYWTGAVWTGTETWLGTSGTATWTYDLGNATFADGTTYTILAKAADTAGNVTPAPFAQSSIAWDASPPTVGLGAPSAAVARQGRQIEYAVTVSGATSVGLDVGDITVESVSGTAAVSDLAVLDGNTTHPRVIVTTGAGNGQLRLRLGHGFAADAADNLNEPVTSAAFEVDNLAPTVTLAWLTPSPSSAETLAGTLEAVEPLANLGLASFSVTNGTVTDVEDSGDHRVFVFTVVPQADGTVGVQCLSGGATDAAGNPCSPSATITIISDRTPPANPGVLASVPNPGGSTALNQLSISWNLAADAHGYSWVLDREPATEPDTVLESILPNILPLSQGEGAYYLHVRAQDRAGNWASATAHLGPWTLDTVPPAAPADIRLAAADDSGLSNSDALTNLTTVHISGHAEAGSTVRLFDLDNQLLGTGGASAFADPGLSVVLPTGYTYIRAKAVDAVGNVSSFSSEITIRIDTVSPEPPAALAGSAETANPRPVWTWISGGSGGAGRFRVRLDAGTWTETSALVFTPAADLPPGLHHLEVAETDFAGNWSAAATTATELLWTAQLTLQPGWNHFSLPGLLVPDDAELLLAQAAPSLLWLWLGSHYGTITRATDVLSLRGCWLYRAAAGSQTLLLRGHQTTQLPALHRGWNCIGFAESLCLQDAATTLTAAHPERRLLWPAWRTDSAGRLTALQPATDAATILPPLTALWLYAD